MDELCVEAIDAVACHDYERMWKLITKMGGIPEEAPSSCERTFNNADDGRYVLPARGKMITQLMAHVTKRVKGVRT